MQELARRGRGFVQAMNDKWRGYTEAEYQQAQHTIVTGEVLPAQLELAQKKLSDASIVVVSGPSRHSTMPGDGPNLDVVIDVEESERSKRVIESYPPEKFEQVVREGALQIVFHHDRRELRRLEKIAMKPENQTASRIAGGDITDADREDTLDKGDPSTFFVPVFLAEEIGQNIVLNENATKKALRQLVSVGLVCDLSQRRR